MPNAYGFNDFDHGRVSRATKRSEHAGRRPRRRRRGRSTSSSPEVFRGTITGPTISGTVAPASAAWLEATGDTGHGSIGTIRFINGQPGLPSESRAGETVECRRFPDAQELTNAGDTEAQSVVWRERVDGEAQQQPLAIVGADFTSDGSDSSFTVSAVVALYGGAIVVESATQVSNPRGLAFSPRDDLLISPGGPSGWKLDAVFYEQSGQAVSGGARGRAVVISSPSPASPSGGTDAGSYSLRPTKGLCRGLIYIPDDEEDPCSGGTWTFPPAGRNNQTHNNGIEAGVLIVPRNADPDTGNLWIVPGAYVIIPEVGALEPAAEEDISGTIDDESTADVEGTPGDESVAIERRVIRIDAVERANASGITLPSGDHLRITLDESYDLVPKDSDDRQPIAIIVPPLQEFNWSLAYGEIPAGELIWIDATGPGCPEGTPFSAFSEQKGYPGYRSSSETEFFVNDADGPRWEPPPDPEQLDENGNAMCETREIVVAVECSEDGGLQVTTETICAANGLVGF